MCGRYSITLPPEAIRQIFQTHGELPNWPVYYNAPPTTALPVVHQGTNGNRELALMQWGLIPWFSKDGKPSYSTINARAEGIRTAASYREPFNRGRRCIVPASGYFEWTGPKNDRQPHCFTRADGQPLRSRVCRIGGGVRTTLAHRPGVCRFLDGGRRIVGARCDTDSSGAALARSAKARMQRM